MSRHRGFTLIELLVVLTIVALLLSIVTPRYIHQADRAKEAALKQNLATIRVNLDRYYADKGRYPGKLEDLITEHYLRRIPEDPITHSSTSWQPVTQGDGDNKVIYDIKSGASGNGLDNTPYGNW